MRARALILIQALALLITTGVSAQIEKPPSVPTAAVLRTQTPGQDGARLGGAVERLVRARLDELDEVQVEGSPGLGLPDLQLAVGCVGDTDACLSAVAAQLEVDALVMSTVDEADDELILTLRFYREGDPRTVTRRTSGERAESALLGQIENAVRELFDLPPVEPEPVHSEQAPESATVSQPGPEESEGLSPVPFIFAAAGLAGIGAGIGFGLKSQSTEDKYAGLPTTTEAEVSEAQKVLDDAEKEALIANIAFAAGGALVATGVVLFIVMRPGEDDEGSGAQVAITPALLKGGGGLAVTGRFGGSL